MIRSFSLLICLACTAVELPAVEHAVLAVDSSKNRLAAIDEQGQTVWEMKVGPVHDFQWLDNGNLLVQTDYHRVVELQRPFTVEQLTGQAAARGDEAKPAKIVWEYDAGESGKPLGRKVEVHSFRRLPDGQTMIAESGLQRLVFLKGDRQTKVIELQVDKPHPHHDTRLVRPTGQGTFLVCHEQDGRVREYATDGSIVWQYDVPLEQDAAPGHGPEAYGNQCFAAIRLESGHTLVSTGNGHRVIEVTADGKVVWAFGPEDVPQFKLAWLTTIQPLADGHLMITNCHAGEGQPQLIEIDRDKQVVWTFTDFERFGNALSNAQLLTTDGQPIR